MHGVAMALPTPHETQWPRSEPLCMPFHIPVHDDKPAATVRQAMFCFPHITQGWLSKSLAYLALKADVSDYKNVCLTCMTSLTLDIVSSQLKCSAIIQNTSYCTHSREFILHGCKQIDYMHKTFSILFNDCNWKFSCNWSTSLQTFSIVLSMY